MTCFLRAWRDNRRYTTTEAAERVDVTAEEFERAERGEQVTAHTRAAIENRFGRTILELTGRVGRGPRRQVH